MASRLNGTGFVDVDVSSVDGNDRLIGPQEGGDDQQVGLGAAHGEVDVGVRCLAQAADQLGGGMAAGVHAVAYGLFQIGDGQGLEDLGMGALTVIIAKTIHKNFPHFLKSNKLMLKSYRNHQPLAAQRTED